MKFHFNEHQRFSLRKYSFGLASVLLGTAFFLSGQVASADEVNVSETLLTSVVSVSPESSTSTSESSVPRTSESKPTVADKSALSPETADSKPTVADKAVVTPETTEVSSDSEKVATESPKSEKSEVSAKESSEDTAKTTEGKAEVAEKMISLLIKLQLQLKHAVQHVHVELLQKINVKYQIGVSLFQP